MLCRDVEYEGRRACVISYIYEYNMSGPIPFVQYTAPSSHIHIYIYNQCDAARVCISTIGVVLCIVSFARSRYISLIILDRQHVLIKIMGWWDSEVCDERCRRARKSSRLDSFEFVNESNEKNVRVNKSHVECRFRFTWNVLKGAIVNHRETLTQQQGFCWYICAKNTTKCLGGVYIYR